MTPQEKLDISIAKVRQAMAQLGRTIADAMGWKAESEDEQLAVAEKVIEAVEADRDVYHVTFQGNLGYLTERSAIDAVKRLRSLSQKGYTVGENGPETFVPDHEVEVIPSERLRDWKPKDES